MAYGCFWISTSACIPASNPSDIEQSLALEPHEKSIPESTLLIRKDVKWRNASRRTISRCPILMHWAWHN
jgi:hypothetical protein